MSKVSYKRPLYSNPDELQIGITLGNEFMFADTLQEYFGELHTYPNGAVYSGAEYNAQTSRQLLPLIRPLQHPSCQRYLQLKQMLMNRYQPPTQYFVSLSAENYKLGKVLRFFMQKINEPVKIYEVDEETFKAWNRSNQPGPNARLYNRDIIQWQLTGDIDLIYKINSDAIQNAEKTLPGIGTYLLTDPTEFAKVTYSGPKNNLFTSGGVLRTSDNMNYVGAYHIRKDEKPYQGAVQISGVDRLLFFI
jgi:hypothetical protein